MPIERFRSPIKGITLLHGEEPASRPFLIVTVFIVLPLVLLMLAKLSIGEKNVGERAWLMREGRGETGPMRQAFHR